MREQRPNFSRTEREPRLRLELSTIMGIDVEHVILTQDIQDKARKQYTRLQEKSNPAQMAEYAWSLRRTLQEALKPVVAYAFRGGERRVNPSKTSLGRARHLSENPELAVRLGVYRLLLNQVGSTIQQELARHEQERNAINGSYEEFKTLEKGLVEARGNLHTLLTRMFKQAGQEINIGDVIERDVLEATIEEFEQNLMLAKEKNPNVAALIEYDTINEYAKQLREEGFIWTPSRRKFLDDILKASLTSRPVVALMGETGVGKTAMVRAVSKILTGREPERAVGGNRENFARLLASPAISEGKSYYKYGPILRAMTGKISSIDTNPSGEGHIFFDDEFNTRPTSVQREIQKFLSEARVGRQVSIPGTPITETVSPGFLVFLAGNPPSERYDREETGIETKREFAGNVLNVEYLTQTPDNPELYQVLLASLMDQKTGRLTTVTPLELAPAWQDHDAVTGVSLLDTDPTAGGFLWRFSNAWGELFKAFSHKDTVLHAKNPSKPKVEYYLPTFILDPGIVLTWMDRYKASPKDRKNHLAKFLLDNLAKYCSQFPEAEQKTVKAYLAHFGIAFSPPFGGSSQEKHLRAIHEREQIKPPATVLTPKEMGYLNPNVPRPIEKRTILPMDSISPLIDQDGKEVGQYVRVAALDIEPDASLARRFDAPDTDVPAQVTFLGIGFNSHDNTMDPNIIHVRLPDLTLKQYDQETFKTLFLPEAPPNPEEVDELRPFQYDKNKAKEYGFSEMTIEAHPEAQKIVDAIYVRDPRFVTLHAAGSPDPDSTIIPPATLTAEKYKINETALKGEWNKNCPNLPNVPEKSLWYFQALADHRLSNTIDGDDSNNLDNPTAPHIPGFGQKSFMLTMNFNEFDWDSDSEKINILTRQTKKILKILFDTQDPTSISREAVNAALWSDHDKRIQSHKAKNVIRDLINSSLHPDDYELRLLRPDEYERAAFSQGYGQKNLWTHMDGYCARDDGHRLCLSGGNHIAGGAADVGYGHRDERHETIAVRLVLSRKSPESRKPETVNFKEARDILGHDNVLGPEAVKATWDRDLAPHEIPPLPYSREQLEGAKRMNMMLVLRVDRDKDGSPLTGEKMNEIIQPKLTAANKGKLLYLVDWYSDEPFYKDAVPKPSWKLVTRDLLPNSTSLDYADQTKLLRDTLAAQPDLTQEERDAIAQADDVSLARLKQAASSNDEAIRKPAAQELAKLMINKNHRRSFADTIFDHASLLQTSGDRLFNGGALYEWTNDLASGGGLVNAGFADSGGADVSGWGPRGRVVNLGVSFSR